MKHTVNYDSRNEPLKIETLIMHLSCNFFENNSTKIMEHEFGFSCIVFCNVNTCSHSVILRGFQFPISFCVDYFKIQAWPVIFLWRWRKTDVFS